MKIVSVLLTSLMVAAASSAFAQGNSDTCHNAMIPCLDLCTQRPSKALQESCTKTCEMNANACYSQLYGTPSRGAGPQDSLNMTPSETQPAQKKSKTSR
jgi:hypothetical protein